MDGLRDPSTTSVIWIIHNNGPTVSTRAWMSKRCSPETGFKMRPLLAQLSHHRIYMNDQKSSLDRSNRTVRPKPLPDLWLGEARPWFSKMKRGVKWPMKAGNVELRGLLVSYFALRECLDLGFICGIIGIISRNYFWIVLGIFGILGVFCILWIVLGIVIGKTEFIFRFSKNNS